MSSNRAGIRVAIATDDGKHVSRHLGLARFFIVYDLKGNEVARRELRAKPRHRPEEGVRRTGLGEAEKAMHSAMADAVQDCRALLAGGMGAPAYESFRRAGVEPLLTDLTDVEDALKAYLEGRLAHHAERTSN